MKTTKKLLSVLLAGSTALSISACSNETGQSGTDGQNGSGTTTTSVSFSEAPAPEIDENSETGTVKVLLYYALDDTQVALFESRYGGTIDTEITSSNPVYFERLATLIATGDSPDIVRYEWNAFPHGMSYNMFTPLDTYVDFSDPLWADMQPLAEQFAYNGKHYYVPYQVTTHYSLNYNNRILQENGMIDPMTLLNSNNWTWSTFEDMLKQWCDKDPAHIGFNGVDAMIFCLSTGTKLIDVKDGEIINNVKDENITRCMQWLESLRKEGLIGACNDTHYANGATTGYVAPSEAFVDGNLLFLGMEPSWTYADAKTALDRQNIPNEMKFIPFPRDEFADKYYVGTDTFGYMVPAGSQNVKGAMDWITFNREEETDPDNIAKARTEALDDSIHYYPVCPNSDCNDTVNPDSKGRHVFTDEENEAGMNTCPSCGTERREQYKVVWSEEQYDLYMEMRSTDGRFSMLFDNYYGFSQDVRTLFSGKGDGLTDGVFNDLSYTGIVESLYPVLESYLQPYRDRMAADARGEEITTTPPEGLEESIETEDAGE